MESHDGRTLKEASKGKLRILQRGGMKLALKLEQIFWSQLDDAARESKTTTSKLVFELLAKSPGAANRTALIRCFCLERARKSASLGRLSAESFDMLGIISACPTPVAVITSERKLAAFNPAFGSLADSLRSGAGQAIQLSFNEPLVKIQQAMIGAPHRIFVFQVGIKVGDSSAAYYRCRFAMADRNKGLQSLIVVFFEIQP